MESQTGGAPPAAVRILFVLPCLEAGGATAMLRGLAPALDGTRHAVDAVACFRPEGAPALLHQPLEAAGVPVDRTPYHLSFEDTVAYLAGLIPAYDVVVAAGLADDVHPAFERLHLRPPLIEWGASVAAAAGPKQHTARFVGTDAAVRDAAAARMPGREADAVVIAPLPDRAAAAAWQRLFDALSRRPAPPAPALFRSFWQGGFECSTHRRAHDRRRIDVIAATGHDAAAEGDYRLLGGHGLRTVRDGVRWHRVERAAGRYDWSSLETQLAGAAAADTEVIWDLLHYGWPDDLDIWSPAFPARFAAFAAAASEVVRAGTRGTRFYCPVNEISFFAWAGGDAGYLNPFARGRGFELKVQLARAAILATEAIRARDPAARFVHVDPVINVVTDPARPGDAPHAEGHRQAQFQGWDLIAGTSWPQLGGRRDLLDIVGVNYYHNNQWIHGGPPIDRRHRLYKPFRRLLAETYARYGRPIFVAETGIEGDARPEWLAYVAGEVRAARRLGVPVAGLCLYPVLDHPGWDDDRPCPNGLLHTLADGRRGADPALARELARQREMGVDRVSGRGSGSAPAEAGARLW